MWDTCAFSLIQQMADVLINAQQDAIAERF